MTVKVMKFNNDNAFRGVMIGDKVLL